MTRKQIERQAVRRYKQELFIKIVGILAIEVLFVGGFIYNLI